VKALLSPEALQQLQEELTPEQRHSLQLVLDDLQDLQGSWEEADEQLNHQEQQLVDLLQQSSTQQMPDDFGRWVRPAGLEGISLMVQIVFSDGHPAETWCWCW
jgi:hypothetical protein